MIILAALAAVVVLLLVVRVAMGIWYDTTGDYVSESWRDEQLRGRRDL